MFTPAPSLPAAQTDSMLMSSPSPPYWLVFFTGHWHPLSGSVRAFVWASVVALHPAMIAAWSVSTCANTRYGPPVSPEGALMRRVYVPASSFSRMPAA